MDEEGTKGMADVQRITDTQEQEGFLGNNCTRDRKHMGESIKVKAGDRYEAAKLVQEGDLAV